MTFQYVVGSGEHAFGYIARVGDHLFQSPLSYYSSRSSGQKWDMAPGYEQNPAPDFTRPVTPECLACHAGRSRPVPETLNIYSNPPFEGTGITCERCHGDTQAHLRRPVPGSILNPAELPPAQRDSICEQCHLAGEVRIPNPGRSLTEFGPGQTLEDVFTVYVRQHGPEDTVKVISQAEQLALSTCKRKSGAKLWCGTCHDPHVQPAQPVEYFRQRCLMCHQTNITMQHAALTNCIGCHMPRRPAKDGGHTAFTDHRISRHPEQTQNADVTAELVAWREPDPQFQKRNLALALVTTGLQNGNSSEAIRGFRMLNRLPAATQHDAEVLTALGSILLTANEPEEARERFEEALNLRPRYAPYEVNVATALINSNQRPEAIRHLERAVELDPLMQKAVSLLAEAYRSSGEEEKASRLLERYRAAMGISFSGVR